MKRKRSKKPLNNDDTIIVTILGIVIMNPHISQHQISSELIINVSPATVCRILHANRIHPSRVLPSLSLAGTP